MFELFRSVEKRISETLNEQLIVANSYIKFVESTPKGKGIIHLRRRQISWFFKPTPSRRQFFTTYYRNYLSTNLELKNPEKKRRKKK
jgi:hypothetical protein